MNLLTDDNLWLIEPSAYQRLSNMPTITQTSTSFESRPYTQNGSLATVPIHGVMMREVTGILRKLYLALDEPFAETGNLAQLMVQLRHDPSVKAVLLDIDSPGGAVNGTPELAAAIARFSREKYVYAFTAGQCCSAAYWIASQCDGIYAAPSARLGSVGVLLPVVDTTEAYSREGIKMEVFAAGKYKSIGVRGIAMTDEQRELLQARVNNTWMEFKAAVNRRRHIDDFCMEGQTFTGTEARDYGLADARSDSLPSLQEKLALRHA